MSERPKGVSDILVAERSVAQCSIPSSGVV